MPDLRFTHTCAGAGCGKPIRPCPYGPVLLGDPPAQPWIMWCNGWLHRTGSHRCHWPAGEYGPEGAARPRTLPATVRNT